ncbi:MAG: glycosyltransferase family 9 protein [Bacteroidales bacterium]|nr:glycosyltransferase family 9 protein [Bacteroidales bacterium]
MIANNTKILIIQTAFIGDVILATPIIEAIKLDNPSVQIDMLVRKGNEGILSNHPKINKLWVWNKKDNKSINQWRIIRDLRKEKFDLIINLQRFMSSGLFTVFSNAKHTIGFDKNPLSFGFSTVVKHNIVEGTHEIERNLSLLASIIPDAKAEMRLYPNSEDFTKVEIYKENKYIVLAPTSVWFTKQYPPHKWIDFINKVPLDIKIYLIGGPDDSDAVDDIISKSKSDNIENLCGKINILQSAALMKDAVMNYVNDSAPQHIASSMGAPTTAIFCSTVPSFGFGPRSTDSKIIEYKGVLNCRPCGLHGRSECKEGHFDCANKIDTEELINRL